MNGSQADISATSNNIANVATTGYKRSKAEFGDIFATSPLQNASSSIGSGTILKGIKQQFTQGNVTSSLNALDLAISGQGFFALRPSLTTNQTVYTRNGSFSVNNDRFVVDSAGQYVLALPVSNDGSVQGGMMTSMLDDVTALLLVIESKGTIYPSSVNLHSHHHRPLFKSKVTATANLLKKGKTIATVQGSIFDKDDKLAATLMHTIFIFNRTERFNKDKS